MIIRRRFRPLGKILQRFGRAQINNYSGVTNMASHADVAPMWEESAQEPLVWQEPPAPTDSVPDIQQQPEPEPQAFTPRQNRTPRDLWLIHDLHKQRLSDEGHQMPSSPWAPSEPANQDAPDVQRRTHADTSTTPSDRPAVTPAPQAVAGRRRGRVIDITPPSTGGLSESQPEPEANDTPDWETQLADDSAPDKPDLYEALVSEGIVQRHSAPDLSDAETFTPTFRTTPSEAPNPVQRAPARPAPENPPTASSASPHSERPAAPTNRPASSATPPVQRESAPPENPVSQPDPLGGLIPAPGTTEAHMLDMLGLPPDTPVVGLNPTAAAPPPTHLQHSSAPSGAPIARPTSPPATPAAPVQRSAAPVDVPASAPPATAHTVTSTPTHPQPVNRRADAPRVPDMPDTLPEQFADPQTPSDQARPVESTPSTVPQQRPPDSLPPVMRQPQSDESAPSGSESPAQAGPQVDSEAEAAFTNFFEAADATLIDDTWPPATTSAAAPVSDQPESSQQPPTAPPATAQRIQRATTPPDSSVPPAPPSIAPGTPDAYGEYEDTQPLDIPADPGQPPRSTVQRAPHPPEYRQPSRDPFSAAESASQAAPGLPDIPSTPADSSPFSSFWSAPPDQPAAPDVRPKAPHAGQYEWPSAAPTPSAAPAIPEPGTQSPRPAANSAPAQSIQRRPARPDSPAPPAPVPNQTHSAPDSPAAPDQTPIGYQIEHVPGISTAGPQPQIRRVDSGKVDNGKFGGKSTVPTGLTDALPGKTDSGMSSKLSESAPSSGGSKGGPSSSAPPPSSIGDSGASWNDWGSQPGSESSSPNPETPAQEVSDSAPAEEGEEGGGDQQNAEANIDKLARDVYNVLKDRLRIEKERRSRR